MRTGHPGTVIARREVEGVEEAVCADHVEAVPPAVERRASTRCRTSGRTLSATVPLTWRFQSTWPSSARERGDRAGVRRRIDDVLDRVADADVLGVERRGDEAAADRSRSSAPRGRRWCWTRGRPRQSRARSSSRRRCRRSEPSRRTRTARRRRARAPPPTRRRTRRDPRFTGDYSVRRPGATAVRGR